MKTLIEFICNKEVIYVVVFIAAVLIVGYIWSRYADRNEEGPE